MMFIEPGADRTFVEVDTRYVSGEQVFWRQQSDGLSIGVSALNMSMDFLLQLAPATVEGLKAAGAVPADFDGLARYRLRDGFLSIASIEYLTDRMRLAAEYSRWRFHAESSPSGLL